MDVVERRQRVTQRGGVDTYVASNPGTRLVSVSERRTPKVGVRGLSPSRKNLRKRRVPKSAHVKTACDVSRMTSVSTLSYALHAYVGVRGHIPPTHDMSLRY